METLRGLDLGFLDARGRDLSQGTGRPYSHMQNSCKSHGFCPFVQLTDLLIGICQALVRAAKAGVQVVYYGCHVEADSIRITGVIGDTGEEDQYQDSW